MLNKYVIFNELCFLFSVIILFEFPEYKTDEDIDITNPITTREIYVGYLLIGLIGIWTIGNLTYLLPVKIYESYQEVKKLMKYFYKSKFEPILNYLSLEWSVNSRHKDKNFTKTEKASEIDFIEGETPSNTPSGSKYQNIIRLFQTRTLNLKSKNEFF